MKAIIRSVGVVKRDSNVDDREIAGTWKPAATRMKLEPIYGSSPKREARILPKLECA
jgi:hypothetical protein